MAMNLLLGISDAAPAVLHWPAVTVAAGCTASGAHRAGAVAGLVFVLRTGGGAFRQAEGPWLA